MEWVVSLLLFLLLAIAVMAVRARRRPKVKHATVNFLLPGNDDEPLTSREAFVSGINSVGLCGEHRQKLIAKLRKGEPVYLVRHPDNPHDSNAVILYCGDGKNIGFLPRATAAE